MNQGTFQIRVETWTGLLQPGWKPCGLVWLLVVAFSWSLGKWLLQPVCQEAGCTVQAITWANVGHSPFHSQVTWCFQFAKHFRDQKTESWLGSPRWRFPQLPWRMEKTTRKRGYTLPSPGLSADTLGIAIMPSHMQGWEKEMSLCRWSLAQKKHTMWSSLGGCR